MPPWLERLVGRLPSALRNLTNKPFAERLLELLPVDDPRVAIRPLGAGDWICPYCIRPMTAAQWDGSAHTLLEQPEIVTHLTQCPAASRKKPKPEMVSWAPLLEAVVMLRLEQRAEYRVADGEGCWVCPHCLGRTGVLLRNWDDSEAPKEWFLPAAWAHLQSCPAFQAEPLCPKRPEEVQAGFGALDLRKMLRHRVHTDPIFCVCDDNGAWIDPFAQKPVEEINLYRTTWGPAMYETIVDYLLSPACPGTQTGYRTEITPEKLYRLAGRLSAQQNATAQRNRNAEIQVELDFLRHQVSALHDTAGQVEDIQKDLAGARKVQKKMLPDRPPRIEDYEVAAFYEPCAELGGDLYQFVEIAGGAWGFLIADVSGHGVEAAMIMSMAMKSFSLRAKDQPSPAAALAAVNRDLAGDLPPGKFITAFYMVLEPASGRLRYARAGHNPTLRVDARKGTIQSLEGNGLPLGVAKPKLFEAKLQESEIPCPPGALLLLYTDGIVEAMNPAKEEFTNRRLSQTLLENAGRSAQQVVEAIVAAVRAHAGSLPMEDDLTLLALRRLEKEDG